MTELLAWAAQNPGRFAYPRGDNFLGATFLKQALLELVEDTAPLYRPLDPEVAETVTAPLWTFLDDLYPHLWRQGRVFPDSGPALRRLMGDGEIDIGLSFNSNEAVNAILTYQWPPTVRIHVHEPGTIGNVHFLAIPFNAAHKAGAMVLANFLMSPRAQLQKQDPRGAGGLTILSMERLDAPWPQRFRDLARETASLAPPEAGRTLPEPHPDWLQWLEEQWVQRYGVQ